MKQALTNKGTITSDRYAETRGSRRCHRYRSILGSQSKSPVGRAMLERKIESRLDGVRLGAPQGVTFVGDSEPGIDTGFIARPLPDGRGSEL